MRAASLNYRDLMIARGSYPGSREEPVIPLSDGAGRKALGSPLDGTLAEQAVFHESGLIHTPDGLSREEAATLPCAGQTAWHALFGAGAPLQPGQTLLTLGTGGVSSFALLFGAAAGADCVVEVGGVGTPERSFQAVAPEGKIGLIGVLSDGENPNPHLLMQHSGHLHGIYVGTINQPLDSFRAMNAAIDVNALQPVVDRTFSLDEVSEAYRALEEAEHFGKIVVTI